MPTFTAIALESLLEPASRNPNPNSKPPPPPARLSLNPPSKKRKIPLQPPDAVSPILYATPEVTPLPDSPSSFPPSPYIINHKRRGPGLVKSSSQIDVSDDLDLKNGNEGELKNEESSVQESCNEEKLGNGVVGNGNYADISLGNGDVDMEEMEGGLNAQVERNGELDDFLDFQDSMSAKSGTHVDDRLSTPSTPVGEYYDAFEEISSDGTTRLSQQNVEDELQEMRLNTLMGIEKRKQAEETIENFQNQWFILTQKLAAVGLVLPPFQSLACESGEQPQHVLQLLGDTTPRLDQYLAEAVEMARQQRYRKKRKRSWIWGSVGLAVALAAAAIAYSYVPSSKVASLSSSSHEAQQHNQK